MTKKPEEYEVVHSTQQESEEMVARIRKRLGYSDLREEDAGPKVDIPKGIAEWAKTFVCQFCKSPQTWVDKDPLSGSRMFSCNCGGREKWRSEKRRCIEMMEFLEKNGSIWLISKDDGFTFFGATVSGKNKDSSNG